MSEQPKGTDALQAEIAREYRSMKVSSGLEIGLRPELGTYELCDKHYDASKTESEAHCAVCKLEAELVELREVMLDFLRESTPANRDRVKAALLQESSKEGG